MASLLVYRQKDIKHFIATGEAKEIRGCEGEPLPDELELFAISQGVNGYNGAILRDGDGYFWGICKRNSLLFEYV